MTVADPGFISTLVDPSTHRAQAAVGDGDDLPAEYGPRMSFDEATAYPLASAA